MSMFKFVERKNQMALFVIGLLIFSGLGASDAQNNEYENRLKQAEQLIRPNIAIFDLNHSTDLKKMTLDLIKVTKDPKIHGILLWIDSSGGNSALTTSVHDTLLRIKKLKPVIALVRGVALSGAYHIATAADYIFAHGESEIGCVGTIGTIRRYKNPKVKEDGIEAELEVKLFTAGKYKEMGSFYQSELSEEEENEMQRGIDAIAKVFVTDVARNRNLDTEKIDQWGEARLFVAHEAVAIGLIDEVGTAFEAEAKMVELIRAKNPEKLVSATVEYTFI